MAGKKKTAKRFGALKGPKKVSAKMEDFDASSKAAEVKGGILRASSADVVAHGCPACPHPPVGSAIKR